jgi:hypothetical protein
MNRHNQDGFLAGITDGLKIQANAMNTQIVDDEMRANGDSQEHQMANNEPLIGTTKTNENRKHAEETYPDKIIIWTYCRWPDDWPPHFPKSHRKGW